jgi:hypothetical protein
VIGLAIVLSLVTPAADVVDASAITFTLDVPKIILGDTKSVTILVKARKKDGTPLDANEPRLAVDLGSVGPLVHRAAGNWTAVYTPPSEGPPQIAIATVALDDVAVGFTILPLWGKGSTAVKTKPNSSVTVKAGNQIFGPVKADASGSATVPLELPPGVRTAATKAVDESGNVADSTIDLGVPPLHRIALIALDEIAVGDGLARLFAVTLDENGQPLANAPVTVKVSDGNVDVGGDVGPGLRAITLHAPRIAHAKAVEVDATLANMTAKATVNVIVGPPSSATISLSRENLADDDDDRNVDVSVRLFDANGNALPPQAGLVHVDIGSIFNVKTTPAPELARTFTWGVPRGTHETRATVAVRTPPGMPTPASSTTPSVSPWPDAANAHAGDVATAGLELLPPKPARLAFDDFDFVVADGENGVDLVVRARDRNGVASSPRGVSFSAMPPSAGHLSAPELVAAPAPPAEGDDAGGASAWSAKDARHKRKASETGESVRVHFTPSVVDRVSDAKVRASMGAISADADVPLAPPPPAWMIRAGVAAGSNFGKLVDFGVDVSAMLRAWGPIYVGVDGSVLQALENQRSYPLLLEGDFRPQISPEVALLLGVAAGPVLSDFVEAPGAKDDFEVALGGQVVVGASLTLGSVPLDAYVRLGTAAYVAPGIELDHVGPPLGVTGVVQWRFSP